MGEEIPTCPYCSKGRHRAEACPRVAAIEYDNNFVDGPRIKRVEFHRPESPEAELTKAFFGDPDKPRLRPTDRKFGWWP
jgi:hypothetical protein